MKTILRLLKGEIIRLLKYKILWFGIALSLIWVVVLTLSAPAEAKALMPFLLVMDSGMMSIILLASGFYYEKQESTIKSVFVAPVSLSQLLIAKVLATLLSSIITMVLVGLGMVIVHGVVINYALALCYIILSTLTHVAIGYVIVFYSRDFMSFLMKYMVVVIVLIIPVLLVAIDVIPQESEIFALISPSYAVKFLMDSLFVEKDIWTTLFGCFVLIALPAILYPLVVYPKFKQFAIKG
ncbi:MAG: hypothetical protein EOM77_03700 [Bacteroidia bacterium]|nr:hypothetical protein [Bacteroidia bacterium]